MKKTSFFLSLMLISIMGFSQFQNNWAINPVDEKGPGGNDFVSDAVTDGAGNIYVTGNIPPNANMDLQGGDYQLNPTGWDFFFAKYNPDGSIAFAKTINSARAIAIDVDNSGNMYIAGHFQGTMDFDHSAGVTELTAVGEYDFFFSKYDNTGELVFAKSFGWAGQDRCYDLKIDDSGNIFVGGYTQAFAYDMDPGASNSGHDFTNCPQTAIFAKYDQNGNYLWGHGLPTQTYNKISQLSQIAVDNAGNLYVVGSHEQTVDFDPGAGSATNTAGNYDAFVVKYDANGNYVYVDIFGNSGTDMVTSISVDDNFFYVGGLFWYTVDFDPGPGTASMTAASSSDQFFGKYNLSDGSYVYAKQYANHTIQETFHKSNGNLLVSGYFSGTFDFDTGAGVAELTSSGSNDYFIAEYDTDGNFVDAISPDGAANDNSIAQLCVDASDNIILAANLAAPLDFDPVGDDLLEIGTANDIGIAKYDDALNYLWSGNIGQYFTGNQYTRDTYTDDAGNVYIVGDFIGAVDFDPSASEYYLFAEGGTDGFFAKYDSNGNFVFAKSIAGTNNVYARAIALDNSNNIFLTGDFNSTADFNPQGGGAELSGANCIFVAKYDSNGQYINAIAMSGSSTFGSKDIDIDNNSNVYIAGNFYQTADFDGSAGTANMTASNHDIFYAKYDSDLNYIYAKQLNSGGNDYGFSIKVDKTTGEGYVAGSYGASTGFNKFDASGNSVFQKTFANNLGTNNFAIALDESNNIYMTSGFTGTVDFDPDAGTANLTSNGGFDIVLAKYDANGAYIFANAIGSPSDDFGRDIALDNNGNIITTGSFSETANFDPAASNDLTSIGGKDIFLAAYDTDGNFIDAISAGGTSDDEGLAVNISPENKINFGGYFNPEATFGANTLTSINHADAFVANYSLISVDCGAELSIATDNFLTMQDAYQLTGDAVIQGDGTIQMTTNATWQTSSVFWQERLYLEDNKSFSANFSFSLNPPIVNNYADGIAFVLQTVSNTAGGAGGGIGYDGISPSLAVEFDVVQNAGEPSNNHVAIVTNGTPWDAHTHVATPTFNMYGGDEIFAWVEYNGATQVLEVRVSNTTARPADPLLTRTVNLDALFGDENVFAGFTSETGFDASVNVLHSFFLENRYSGSVLSPECSYTQAPTNIQVTSAWTEINLGTAEILSVFVENYDASAAIGRNVTITIDNLVSTTTYTATTDDAGIATFDITGLSAGTSTVTLTDEGGVTTTFTFEIIETFEAGCGAVNFDATNDYVSLGTGLDFRNSDLTIEFLSKRERESGQFTIFTNGTWQTNNCLHISQNLDAGFLRFGFFNNDLTYFYPTTDNEWHHYAFTYEYDADLMKMYIDGTLVASKTLNGKYAGTGETILGANRIGTENFGGGMDEFRIWNVVRTQEEIVNKMDDCLSGTEYGLINYLKFDEGTGTSTQDITQNGNGGTLVNMSEEAWTASVLCCGEVLPPCDLSVLIIPISDVCFGETGTLTAEVAGGIGNIIYDWSNGENQDVIENALPNMEYTVNVYDENGCTYSDTFTFGENPEINIEGTTTEETTFGANDGTIDITVTGGTPTYTYEWSNAENTEDLVNLPVGFYSVVVTDASSCTAEETFEIETSPSVAQCGAIQFDGVNDFGYLGEIFDYRNTDFTVEYWTRRDENTGSCVYVSSGSWATDRGFHILHNLDGGWLRFGFFNDDLTVPISIDNDWHHHAFTYETGTRQMKMYVDGVMVGSRTTYAEYQGTGATRIGIHINNNDKLDGAMDELRIWNTVRSEAEISACMSSCLDGGETGLVSYWKFEEGQGTDIAATTGGGAGALYNVDETNVWTNSVLCCGATAPCDLTLELSQTEATVCYSDFAEVTATVSGGTTPYQYLWSNNVTTQTNSTLEAGVNQVTVLDAANCQIEGEVFVEENPEIQIFVESTDETAQGLNNGTIDLTIIGGTPPYSVEWNDLNFDEDRTNLAPGIYDAIITDFIGCTAEVEVMINAGVLCEFSISTDVFVEQNPVCFGGSTYIDVFAFGDASPFTYEWSNGSTEPYIYVPAGTYTVTVTDFNGCTTTESITVEENPALEIAYATTPESFDGASDGAIDISVTGGTMPFSFLWNNYQTDEDLTNLPAGIYDVTVTDANGCEANEGIMVELDACDLPLTPVITASTTDFCTGEDITLDFSGAILNDAAHWALYENGTSPANVLEITTGTSFVVSPLQTTTYYIRGEGNCVDFGPFAEITLTNDMQAPVADMPILEDIVEDCYFEITEIPTATDYCDGIVEATTTDPLVYDNEGTYTIYWTYTDSNGNTTMQTQNVTINVNNAILTADAGADFEAVQVVIPQEFVEFNLNAVEAIAPATGLWSHNNQNVIIEQPTLYNSLVTNAHPGHHTYVWTVSYGACQVQDEVNVMVRRDIINSGAKGNWHAPESWLPATVPTEYDNVFITNGSVNITTAFDAFANKLEVYDNGNLNMQGVEGSGDATLTAGEISIYQTVDAKGNANIIVNGGSKIEIIETAENAQSGTFNVFSGGTLAVEQGVNYSLDAPHVYITNLLNIEENNASLTDPSATVRIGDFGNIQISGDPATKAGDKVVMTGNSRIEIQQDIESPMPAIFLQNGGNIIIGENGVKDNNTPHVRVRGGRIEIAQDIEKGVSGEIKAYGNSRIELQQDIEKSGVASSIQTPQLLLENSSLIIGDTLGQSSGNASLTTGYITVMQTNLRENSTPNILLGAGAGINLYEINDIGNEAFINLSENGTAELRFNSEIFADNSDIPIFYMNELGSIIDSTDNGTAINGYVEFEREYTEGTNNFASPVANISNNEMSANEFLQWSEANNAWEQMPNSAEFETIKGYKLDYTTTTTENITGPTHFNMTSVSLTNSDVSSPNNSGWNLLGNPFTSAFDWEQVSLTDIENTVYVYDDETQNFKYYQQGGASLNGGSQLVNISEGFFVKVNPTATTAEFGFNQARVHNVPGLLKLKTNDEQRLTSELLTLTLSDGEYTDQTILGLENGATANFESNKDIFKLLADIPQFYTVTPDNENLALNIFDISNGEVDTVPLNVAIPNSGSFTINADLQIGNTDIGIFLHDKLTDEMRSLRVYDTYEFDFTAGENDERFEIIFDFAGLIQVADNQNDVQIYSFGNDIVVNNPIKGAYKLEVFNVVGAKVYEGQISEYEKQQFQIPYASGVYHVRLSNGSEAITQKVIIMSQN